MAENSDVLRGRAGRVSVSDIWTRQNYGWLSKVAEGETFKKNGINTSFVLTTISK